MGFSTSLSTAILFIPLVISLVIYASIYNSMVDAISSIPKLSDYRSIVVRITSAWLDNSTNETVYLYLENAGSLPIWNFNMSDLLVHVSDTTGDHIYMLSYGRDWNVTTIVSNGVQIAYTAGDSIYPGESALIRASLPSKVSSPYRIIIIFVYESGSRAMYRLVG